MRRRNEPTQHVRGLVLARDDFSCLGCGRPVGGAYTWWSLQHRIARGVGGGNTPENLVALCGSATSPGCHLRCEQRDPVMHDRGLWLASSEDPLTVPVITWDARVLWLTADGGTITEAAA